MATQQPPPSPPTPPRSTNPPSALPDLSLPTPSQHPFFRPGLTVAIIGAGVSGVTTAAHALRQGLRPTVFERAAGPGGVWVFDPLHVAPDPSYPSETPSVGDYVVTKPSGRGAWDAKQRVRGGYATPPPEGSVDEEASKAWDDNDDDDEDVVTPAPHPLFTSPTWTEQRRHFAPPGPAYAGLTNNVPTTLMVSSLSDWPAGTPENTTHDRMAAYVQALAREHGVDRVARYGVRVDEVAPTAGGRWSVRTVELVTPPSRGGEDRRPREVREETREFDAVVACSGHYSLPRIPAIPGLAQLKKRFPVRVTHSKQYRVPAPFRGGNVLVIGAGVSAWDIIKEIDALNKKSAAENGAEVPRIFQSTRNGIWDIPASLLPEGVERVAEVVQLLVEGDDAVGSDDNEEGRPLPAKIILADGTSIPVPIHHIVLGTGYITSYPFLKWLHRDGESTTATPSDKQQPLPADGGLDDRHVLVDSVGDATLNLHRDIFYMPRPTLGFVGVPYYTATFALFDFQAQLVARVLSGSAKLPSTEEMREEYDARVRAKGSGRLMHSLRGDGEETGYVASLVQWANHDTGDDGLPVNGNGEKVPRMEGHTAAWLARHEQLKEQFKELRKWGRKDVPLDR